MLLDAAGSGVMELFVEEPACHTNQTTPCSNQPKKSWCVGIFTILVINGKTGYVLQVTEPIKCVGKYEMLGNRGDTVV